MPYQLVQDIYIFQSSIWQTNCSVITNEAANIVIDPCYFPVEIQVIADFVNRRRSFNKWIIFTHSDFDHIVGYQCFKGAKLMGHEDLNNCDKDFQLIQLAEIDQTYTINRKDPFTFPEPDITFRSEYRIPLKDEELLLFHAPGHTADSIFVVSTAKKVLFAGDYLSDLEFPFVYFNTGAYLKTLELAEELVNKYALEYVVPGHGDIACDRDEITMRINGDREYLENLVQTAQELMIQGLQLQEVIDVLKGIKYRNEQIDGAMLKMHLENVRLVLKELQAY